MRVIAGPVPCLSPAGREISENLHRAELTALERDKLVAEWVELTGEKVPQSGAVCSGGRGNKEGIREAARQLPVSGDTEKAREHQIARALKVASLSPEAQDAAREVGRRLDTDRNARQNRTEVTHGNAYCAHTALEYGRNRKVLGDGGGRPEASIISQGQLGQARDG